MYFISRLQYFFLVFLSLFCAARYWQYNIGVNIFIFDLVVIAFIVVSVLRVLANNGRFCFHDKRLKFFFMLLFLVFFVKTISFIGVIDLGLSQGSLMQFFAQFTTELVFLLFSFLLINYLGMVSNSDRDSFVRYFILGGVFSSVYGVAHIYFLTNGNINVDNYIWDVVASSYVESTDVFLTYSMNGVLRGKGFAGSNASATYYVAIIPLVAMLAFSSVGAKRVRFIMYAVLLVLGEFVIMSRTGIITFILALITLFFLLKKIRLLFAILILVVMAMLLSIYNSDPDTVAAIIESRVHLNTDRYFLYEGAIQVFSENPLIGIGLNNYSEYMLSANNSMLHDENLHSSWWTIGVETGSLGLVSYIALFLYVVKVSYKKSSIYSKPFISAVIPLMLAGVFNQLFELFYFNFFLVLIFSVVILSDGGNKISKGNQR
jgi:O-antigen ligase